MPNAKKFYFFRCTFCGTWFYTPRRIKRKICFKCNHSFKFEQASKFSKNCSVKEAIAIIKELKKRENKENLIKYLKNQ